MIRHIASATNTNALIPLITPMLSVEHPVVDDEHHHLHQTTTKQQQHPYQFPPITSPYHADAFCWKQSSVSIYYPESSAEDPQTSPGQKSQMSSHPSPKSPRSAASFAIGDVIHEETAATMTAEELNREAFLKDASSFKRAVLKATLSLPASADHPG
jgi:hypothetical protein